MKVFVLIYYDYDDTRFYGVFSTLEKAAIRRDELVQESKRTYGSITTFRLKSDYFDIEEEEVK